MIPIQDKIEALRLLSDEELTERVDTYMKGKYLHESLMKLGFKKWAPHLQKELCDKTGIVKIDGYAEPIQSSLKEDEPGDLILADRDMLVKKVMFYREQTEKLRQYIHDKKIGLPSQGFFDAIYDHLESQSSLTPKSIRDSDAVEFAKFIHTNYAPTHSLKWVKRNIGDGVLFTTEELYKLFNPASLKPNKLSGSEDMVSREEYEHAINEIGHLQEQLKEAEREINNLNQSGGDTW